MKLRLTFCLFFTFLTAFLYAQNTNCNIIITDSLTNERLPFANIYLKKSGQGTSTDLTGSAKLKIPVSVLEDILVISYVGYHTKEVPYQNNQQTFSIQLRARSQSLGEVVVTDKKLLKPKQIIKKAIKNTSQNYAKNDVVLKCLFRETIKEEGKFIRLDEAFTDVYYTSYPKKKLDRKIWKSWFYDETYAFDMEGSNFMHRVLRDYNTKEDKVKVVASRSSDNWSNYGIEVIYTGGPLLLTAFDKIKYQYDFLNPKLLNKYDFKYDGVVYINGATCDVISFYPKSSIRSFSINESKKNKFPIYIGKVYIEKETFAITKCEYQLAVSRDFGFFENTVPLDYRITINYSKRQEKWHLHSIHLDEVITIYTSLEKKIIPQHLSKSLYVLDIETENIKPFSDSTLWKSTRFTTIRNYYDKYNADYWKDYELSKFCELDAQIVSDLSEEKSLEEQFRQSAIEPQELAVPTTFGKPFSFKHHDEIIADSLHWMANPTYEKEFIDYLQTENKYAKNHLLTNRQFQKKIFNNVNTFYKKEEDVEKKRKVGLIYWDIDSLNAQVVLHQKDSVNSEIVHNWTEFEKTKDKIQLRKLEVNKSKKLYFVQYEKFGIAGDFIEIFPFGKNEPIDSIKNVYESQWLNNSQIIYVESDYTRRGGELYLYDLETKKKTFLYKENDKTFDISLVQRGKHLLCYVLSKSETEIYLIDTTTTIPTLKMIEARQKGIYNEIQIYEDDWYMMTNKGRADNQILKATKTFPFEWKPVAPINEGDYITGFKLSKNFIIVTVYEESFFKVKYLKKGKRQWEELSMDTKFGQIGLGGVRPKSDTLYLYYSAPSVPDTYYQYDLANNTRDTINSAAIENKYVLKSIKTKRLWAKGKKGLKIPITLYQSKQSKVYHKGLILRVYGAYGAIINPAFSAEDVTLMQNGYTIAYAHVRGSSTMGTNWYKDGKLMNKKNSFEDYITCVKYLIKKKITSPEYLVAEGTSAGGLIMSWAANEYPELFNTIILDHPAVDVVNLMMNDSLPLTTDEYKELGNPNDINVYNYMKSYSPFHNVKKQAYPNMIFIAGYFDYQTKTWQTAKHVATLRASNTADSEIIFLTDMNSGHSGNSSYTEQIKVFSQVYSFVNMNLFATK